MTTLPSILAACSDPSRLRILSALRGGDELCACHLIELTALAPSTISKHMDTLRSAGLVLARRDGKWMHYRLPRPSDSPPLVRSILAWLSRATDLDGEARAQSTTDSRRLTAILSMNPEDLCCTQRARGPGKAVPALNPACCSSAPATPAARRSPRAGPATSSRT